MTEADIRDRLQRLLPEGVSALAGTTSDESPWLTLGVMRRCELGEQMRWVSVSRVRLGKRPDHVLTAAAEFLLQRLERFRNRDD